MVIDTAMNDINSKHEWRKWPLKLISASLSVSRVSWCLKIDTCRSNKGLTYLVRMSINHAFVVLVKSRQSDILAEVNSANWNHPTATAEIRAIISLRSDRDDITIMLADKDWSTVVLDILEYRPKALQQRIVKDRWVQTDNVFSPSDQCTEAVNKARRLISMTRRSFQDLLKSASIPLYGALVRPQLEHGMPACSSNFEAEVNHLERIQG